MGGLKGAYEKDLRAGWSGHCGFEGGNRRYIMPQRLNCGCLVAWGVA